MKKLLFVLFLILSASVMANDSLLTLLKDQHYNLTQGVVLKEMPPLHDFTTLYTTKVLPVQTLSTDDSPITDYMCDWWYSTDFAADPFDGRIEIMVMGEPLPPTTTTLLISIALVGLLLYKNKFRVVV